MYETSIVSFRLHELILFTVRHSTGVPNLFTSPSIITVMKSRTMKWTEHATGMEENRNTKAVPLHATNVLMGQEI
jgi:hypothetical protein